MFHWIVIHFLIHYLPFNIFAVCCSFSITLTLNTDEAAYEWSLFSVVCLRLYILSETSSILTTDFSSDFGFSSPSLSLFNKNSFKLLTFIICTVITAHFSAMHFTTPEQEPLSLSRLKIGLELWVAKKAIVCQLSCYISVCKENTHLKKRKENIMGCEKKAWKNFRLVWDSKAGL